MTGILSSASTPAREVDWRMCCGNFNSCFTRQNGIDIRKLFSSPFSVSQRRAKVAPFFHISSVEQSIMPKLRHSKRSLNAPAHCAWMYRSPEACRPYKVMRAIEETRFCFTGGGSGRRASQTLGTGPCVEMEITARKRRGAFLGHSRISNSVAVNLCDDGGRDQRKSDGVELQKSEEVANLVGELGRVLKSDPGIASHAASSLVTSLDKQGRSVLLVALFASASDNPEDHFSQADTNSDGLIDRAEFGSYVEAQAVKYGQSTQPLTREQTVNLFGRAAIGMVGFGFTDNAIMIIAGDTIQNTIGGALGLTTLLSAGLGNAVADLVGTAFRGYIERVSGKFMPEVALSSIQMEQKEAWWAETTGASLGVTVGCLLGLAPLFFIGKSDGQSPALVDQSINVVPSEGDIGGQFASVSTPFLSPPKSVQLYGHRFGSPSLLVGIVMFLVLKRVGKFLHERRQMIRQAGIKR